MTEDPEPIGAGRILLEAGRCDSRRPLSGVGARRQSAPPSTIGLSVGLSSVAEFQIDGGFYDRLNISRRNPAAPLASLLTVTGDSTHDVDDFVVATKIRFVAETMTRPALGIRFATKLPNASNEAGLGLDTLDFFVSLLGAKTVQSVRVVGNLGFAILSDPTVGNRQNDVFTYGVSFARALTQQVEIVGEVNGRVSTRTGEAFPGTETRGQLRIGGRYTHNAVRVDARCVIGLTSVDATVGLTAGVTLRVQRLRSRDSE